MPPAGSHATATRRSSRARRFLQAFVLNVVLIGVTLIVIELILRAVNPFYLRNDDWSTNIMTRRSNRFCSARKFLTRRSTAPRFTIRRSLGLRQATHWLPSAS
jgi:hypothetical protein